MKEKTAGILGGMGPEATVDLMRRIIAHTDARDDADHVRCIVDNNPKVPSRIKALLEGGGVSPGPCLADMARRLEAWGADFLCMACNTAHNYYGEVRAAVGIPVLNMVELTARAASELAPGGAAGILASPAVRLTGLYEGPCAALGLTPRVCRRSVGATPFAGHQRCQGGPRGRGGARGLCGDSRARAEQGGRRC